MKAQKIRFSAVSKSNGIVFPGIFKTFKSSLLLMVRWRYSPLHNHQKVNFHWNAAALILCWCRPALETTLLRVGWHLQQLPRQWAEQRETEIKSVPSSKVWEQTRCSRSGWNVLWKMVKWRRALLVRLMCCAFKPWDIAWASSTSTWQCSMDALMPKST